MKLSVARICDSRYSSVEDAIREAKLVARVSPRFELNIVRFLQAQCLENPINLPVIYQGLDILAGISDENRLLGVLGPFLRSKNLLIASKCVMVAGRQCGSPRLLIDAFKGTDDRMRANLLESLWRRPEPEVEELLTCGLKDKHHRVVANAVYGLYLRGSDSYREGFDRLFDDRKPDFRRAGVWVARMIGDADAIARLKSMIRDPDPQVRHAAFRALVHFRDNGTGMSPEARTTGERLVTGALFHPS